MAIRICPECGGKCTDKRDDCPHCGYVFAKTKICPECEAVVNEDVKECPECGFVFNEITSEEKNDVVAPVITPTLGNASENNNVSKKVQEEKKEIIKEIRCPSCGSIDVETSDGENGICKRCGSKLLINPNKNIINVVNIQTSSNNSFGLWILKEQYSEKEVFKKALISLCFDEVRPLDIYDRSFELERIHKNVIFGQYNVQLTYSAQIGTDYTETTTYGDGHKERKKITKWQPMSGAFNSIETIAVDRKTNEMDSLGDDINTISQTYKISSEYADESGLVAEPPTPQNETALNTLAIDNCKDKCKKSLTGDHIDDFNASGFANPVKIESYAYVGYLLKYEYNGQSHKPCYRATGETSNISDNAKDSKGLNKGLRNLVDTKFLIPNIIIVAVSFALAILAIVLRSDALITIAQVLGIVMPIAILIVYIVVNNKTHHRYCIENINARKDGLIKALDKYGLEPLNAEDEKIFEKEIAKYEKK